jgi:hypothetical protein
MSDPGKWFWLCLLTFLHWLWSVRVYILIGVAVVAAESQIKKLLIETYASALNQTVVPLLEEIAGKVRGNG